VLDCDLLMEAGSLPKVAGRSLLVDDVDDGVVVAVGEHTLYPLGIAACDSLHHDLLVAPPVVVGVPGFQGQPEGLKVDVGYREHLKCIRGLGDDGDDPLHLLPVQFIGF